MNQIVKWRIIGLGNTAYDKDIIEGKTQASFPGINKKNILLNSKIITDWMNA